MATADSDTVHPFFSFWWAPDGVGGFAPNETVQDGFYIQDDTLAGNDIAFSGFAVANTLSAPASALNSLGAVQVPASLEPSGAAPVSAGLLALGIQRRRR